VVARLADELAAEARMAIEDQARSVGIKAAVPLGLCLLPAFLLVGIVPVVAAAITALRW
jgi:pilus assembly protein TadC